jgi:hypothetical protein
MSAPRCANFWVWALSCPHSEHKRAQVRPRPPRGLRPAG